MTTRAIHMNTVWYQDVKGNGRIQSENIETQIAIPVSKGGGGKGADPQQLLISSAAACYTMTLTYMLDSNKVPVADFSMDTEGLLSEEDQLSIVHYPHIVLSSEATQEAVAKVQKMIVEAEEQCHVGQLLIKAGISIDVKGKVSK